VRRRARSVIVCGLALVALAAFACSGSTEKMETASAVRDAAPELAPASQSTAEAWLSARDAAFGRTVTELQTALRWAHGAPLPGKELDPRDLLARRDLLRKRLADLKRATPPVGPTAEVEWRTRSLAQQIESLTVAAEDRALRGDVAVYGRRAEVEWHLQLLRDLIERSHGDPALVPESPLRLVDRGTLEDLKAKHLARVRWLERRQAGTMHGVLEPALRGARRQLDEVEKALSAGPVDLEKALPRAPGPDPGADASWLATRQAARDAWIEQRRRELLQLALARDGSDLAVRVELEAHKATIETAAAATARVRSVVLERYDLMASLQAKAVLRGRILDPMGAAWGEARLASLWRRSGSATPFAEWLASLLTDADLVEVQGWHFAVERARAGESAVPIAGRDLDLRSVDLERGAVAAEVAARAGGARRALVLDLDVARSLSDLPIPRSAAEVPFELRADLWQALVRLEVRSAIAPAVRAMIVDLEVRGLVDQLALLRSHTVELAHAVAADAPLGASPMRRRHEALMGMENREPHYVAARQSLARQEAMLLGLHRKLVEQGMDLVQAESVDQAFAALRTASRDLPKLDPVAELEMTRGLLTDAYRSPAAQPYFDARLQEARRYSAGKTQEVLERSQQIAREVAHMKDVLERSRPRPPSWKEEGVWGRIKAWRERLPKRTALP
jgi:hypothetical protein